MKLKVKDVYFCFIPAMVGILKIFFTVINALSETASIYREVDWIFFLTFFGLVFIANI
jgi:hypothetical protein